MGIISRENAVEALEYREIVMGLRFRCAGMQAGTVDLNALCLLQDAQGRLLEKIHPGHTRNAGGSVVHTGSAVTASANWDHERIFVFLDALPAEVARVSFVVSGSSGAGLGHAVAASCHISDRNSEQLMAFCELDALRDSQQVALLVRQGATWRFVSRHQSAAQTMDEADEQIPLLARPESGRLAANG